jgi:hypothetical protein
MVGCFQDEVFGVFAARPLPPSSSPRASAASCPPPGHLYARGWIEPQSPVDGRSLKAATLDQSLNLGRSARDDGMADFSIRMNNRLQFSNCETPHIPTSRPHEETLIVELNGDLLTITARRADGGLGSRIYAQRAIDLPEASIFTILPELPSHVRDGSFFSARGTIAILATHRDGRRRLRAVGTDKNSGRRHGWIFDAIEEAGPGSNRA